MSTWIYLHCLDHDPPLSADAESGQHLGFNVDQAVQDITDREKIIAAAAIDCHPDDHFRRNTARFLIHHPRCRIGIRDEYGQWHPTPDDPDATGGHGDTGEAR